MEMACLGTARQVGAQVSTMVRQIILAGFVVLLPTGLCAQGRGMMAPASRAVSVAPRVMAQAPHVAQAAPVGTRVIARNGMVRPRNGTPTGRIATRPVSTHRHLVAGEISHRTNCNSAPGLGFDAVHQAAVCGPGVIGRRRSVAQVPLFFPFFGGEFNLPGSAVAMDDSSVAEDSQQEDIDAENREYARRHRNSQPAQVSAPVVGTDSAVLQDTAEFVFVRRDGTLFFAVAYTWENGTLRYINSQGLKQTVTQDALDLGATQQFNEQRGLNFHSPA